MTTTDNRAADNHAEPAIIEQLIENARQAMTTIAAADQLRIDEWVTAVAWALYKPENAERLANSPCPIPNLATSPIKPPTAARRRARYAT